MPELELAGEPRARVVREVLLTAAVATIGATAASAWTNADYVASAVGGVFLAATWFRVWRENDAVVERFGLTLGGLMLAGRADALHVARSLLRTLAIGGGVMLVIGLPFAFLWKGWWAPHRQFVFPWTTASLANLLAGQLFVIALPEEAFYRGYVQTRLDDVWLPRWRLFGANVGPSVLVTSVIFAVGHILTIHNPARLAVFFPALLFGWLRARTKGIGAAVVFHALCNVLAETLGRGYGIY